eukprot:COSAG02_NODE_1280_length_13477_cov_9.042906_8_plen_235_part_00
MNHPAPALVLSAAAFVGACCSGLPRTVVLIGMRGVGKTTLGKGAAEALGFDFEDLDRTLEEDVGMTCRDFVAAHGWEAFRSKELEVLTASLSSRGSSHSRGRVLACGGGVVESAHTVALLRAWRGGKIVWIDRPIDAIATAFGEEGGRPWAGLDEAKLREIFARRKPLYEHTCDHQLSVSASCDTAAATVELTGWIEQSTDGQHEEPSGTSVMPYCQVLGLLLLCLRQQFSPNR